MHGHHSGKTTITTTGNSDLDAYLETFTSKESFKFKKRYAELNTQFEKINASFEESASNKANGAIQTNLSDITKIKNKLKKLTCAISSELLNQPVYLSTDAELYDYDSVVKIFNGAKTATHPTTGKSIGYINVIPAITKKIKIQQLIEQYAEKLEILKELAPIEDKNKKRSVMAEQDSKKYSASERKRRRRGRD